MNGVEWRRSKETKHDYHYIIFMHVHIVLAMSVRGEVIMMMITIIMLLILNQYEKFWTAESERNTN